VAPHAQICDAAFMAKSQTRRSAGVAVVRETPDGARFLLLRAYRNWDFPKGLVETGEEPLAAAMRETREETGIDDLEFAWGTEFIETAPYAGGKVARYYVARTRAARITLPINAALGRAEHHEHRWVDLTEALALTVPRLQRVVAWAAGKVMAAATIAQR
jgi:8-oxo-dGTP pyrophosphatase MutT (NUDIX family)